MLLKVKFTFHNLIKIKITTISEIQKLNLRKDSLLTNEKLESSNKLITYPEAQDNS